MKKKMFNKKSSTMSWLQRRMESFHVENHSENKFLLPLS